jgi:hypothetical protein
MSTAKGYFQAQELVSGEAKLTKTSPRIIIIKIALSLPEVTLEALNMAAELGYTIRAGVSQKLIFLERVTE